jgi:hypothetical protein
VRTTELRRLIGFLILAIATLAACSAPPASGVAPASPKVSCTGVPAVKCDEAVASVARSLPNSAPVAIDVTCASGTCTAQNGAMDTVVTLPDGSQLRSSTLSWSEPDTGSAGGGTTTEAPRPAPIPEPVVPVQPACLGVPASMCATMAETAFGELPMESVIAIVVRCTEPPCTDKGGTGDTVVSYADGTTRSSSWEYAGN